MYNNRKVSITHYVRVLNDSFKKTKNLPKKADLLTLFKTGLQMFLGCV